MSAREAVEAAVQSLEDAQAEPVNQVLPDQVVPDPAAQVADEAPQGETSEEKEAAAQAQLAKKQVESSLVAAGLKLGVDEKALPDYINRGLSVFSYEQDKIVGKKSDGTPIFSKVRAGEHMSVEEWAESLLTDAPHLFRASKGGGAGSTALNGGPKKFIQGGDPLVFGQNLEAIAKGETVVTLG